MKTIRRMLYSELLSAIGFVTLGFLVLFSFFDLVDELRLLGRGVGGSYQLPDALLYVALLIPTHLYDLLPIAVLIGSIYVMARLAKSSEFTILRTSGLGPWRVLDTLLSFGLMFALLTLAVGDYVSPVSERGAQLLKARFTGDITVGLTGAWLKEQRADHSWAVNVSQLSANGQMRGVRLFEFDERGFLVSRITAERGRFGPGESWTLDNVRRDRFLTRDPATARVEHAVEPTLRWDTSLSAEMVAATLLRPDRMSTFSLFEYIGHLKTNSQTAQVYEIEFWRRIFYPVSCLVMVVLALPFAYLHFRTSGITGYVFGGVLAGISFVILNNLFGYIGNLNNWLPWVAAGVPGAIYMVLSLAAFGWLVLRR